MARRARIVAAAVVLVVSGATATGGGAQEPDRQTFTMLAENMVPRFSPGQRIEFDLAAYRSSAPAVGDIVVIHPSRGMFSQRPCGRPRQPAVRQLCVRARTGLAEGDVRIVTRVVAVGGDRVRFRRGRVIRNGRRERRRGLRACDGELGCTFRRAITIPAGHVYLAGDNRPASDDSRFWGALPVRQVVGRYVRTVG